MKKIMISLLMIAASLNAMAITYTGKVQVVLRATSNNAACAAIVATSDALNDGLNPMYYAELNDDGKEVLVYVEYESTRYEHFGSSATTMRNMPLIMKANASGEYRMNFYEMEGTIEIYDKVAGANIDKSQPYIFTIEDVQKNTIIADRFVINYNPAPVYAASVTTNEFGFASFSWDADLEAVAAEGLEIYKGELDGITALDLLPVDYVKAGEGVIVKGTANTEYHFNAGTGTSDFDGNDLKASATWNDGLENVYCLVGNELRHYIGTDAFANKAFIQLPNLGPNPAPARISLRFGQTTAIDNVEAGAQAEKFIENGQVLIRRGNEVYTLQGQIVK